MAFLTGISGANAIQPKENGAGFSNSKQLPAGGYVCKVLEVKVDKTRGGKTYIGLRFDVSEGAYAGHFQQRFQADAGSLYGQKWKGVFKIFLPQMTGDAGDYENDIATYKGKLFTIAHANRLPEPDIEQGFDPDVFKGCTVGILFRDAMYNGNAYTEPAYLIDPQRVRTGDYETPNPRQEKPQQQNHTGYGGFYQQPAQTAQQQGSVFTTADYQQQLQQPAQASSPIYAAAQQQGYSQPLQQPTTSQQKQQRFQQVCEQMLQEAFPEPLQPPQQTFQQIAAQQMAAQQPMQQPVPSAFTMPQNVVQTAQQPIPGGNLSDFAEQVITGDVPF